MADAAANECQGPGFYAMAVHGATAPKDLVVINRSMELEMWLNNIRRACNSCRAGTQACCRQGTHPLPRHILREGGYGATGLWRRKRQRQGRQYFFIASLYRGLHGSNVTNGNNTGPSCAFKRGTRTGSSTIGIPQQKRHQSGRQQDRCSTTITGLQHSPPLLTPKEGGADTAQAAAF